MSEFSKGRSTPLFEHIGPRVEDGDVTLAPDELELFRSAALKGVKLKELQLDDRQTKIVTLSHTSGLLSEAWGDYDVYANAFYAKTELGGNDLDFWRSVISFARYNDKNRGTKIYNIYEVEGSGEQPHKALRTVRIIRNLSRIAFDDDGNPYDDKYSEQYKSFERPMTTDDVLRVSYGVERISARNRATGGR